MRGNRPGSVDVRLAAHRHAVAATAAAHGGHLGPLVLVRVVHLHTRQKVGAVVSTCRYPKRCRNQKLVIICVNNGTTLEIGQESNHCIDPACRTADRYTYSVLDKNENYHR